jgi:hypothetical protein
MAITRLMLTKDNNGNVTYGMPFSNNIWGTTLAANVAQSCTVPGNSSMQLIAVFSYSSGCDVFVNPVTTAAVPGSSFAQSATELNPVMRTVTGGSTLSVISPASGYITISFYLLNYSSGVD